MKNHIYIECCRTRGQVALMGQTDLATLHILLLLRHDPPPLQILWMCQEPLRRLLGYTQGMPNYSSYSIAVSKDILRQCFCTMLFVIQTDQRLHNGCEKKNAAQRHVWICTKIVEGKNSIGIHSIQGNLLNLLASLKSAFASRRPTWEKSWTPVWAQ